MVVVYLRLRPDDRSIENASIDGEDRATLAHRTRKQGAERPGDGVDAQRPAVGCRDERQAVRHSELEPGIGRCSRGRRVTEIELIDQLTSCLRGSLQDLGQRELQRAGTDHLDDLIDIRQGAGAVGRFGREMDDRARQRRGGDARRQRERDTFTGGDGADVPDQAFGRLTFRKARRHAAVAGAAFDGNVTQIGKAHRIAHRHHDAGAIHEAGVAHRDPGIHDFTRLCRIRAYIDGQLEAVGSFDHGQLVDAGRLAVGIVDDRFDVERGAVEHPGVDAERRPPLANLTGQQRAERPADRTTAEGAAIGGGHEGKAIGHGQRHGGVDSCG